MQLKDNMTYEEKVEFFFENDDRRGELTNECICYVIGNSTQPTTYTLTVDSRQKVTEIRVHEYEKECEVKLEDVLEEYGVYDWTDLPTRFTGCCFCPFRHECDIVREEVEDYWQTFID